MNFENGAPVASVDFDYPSEENTHDDAAAIRQEAMMRLIQFLAVGSVEAIGRRVELIAFLLHVSECATQRSLAQKLGISEAAISKKVKSVRAKIARLNDAKPVSNNSKVKFQP